MGKHTAYVNAISYNLIGKELCLSLSNFPYPMFVKPEEIHFGGKNCEIGELVVGSKISCEYSDNPTRQLKNVIVMSDGIREVDENGTLIKW